MKKAKRCKQLLPISEYTYKELSEAITNMEYFIEEYKINYPAYKLNNSYCDYLNRLILERAKRIGRKK